MSTEHWQDEFLRHFVRTLGDVATSAHLCGKSARAISKRERAHPEFAILMARARERVAILRRVSTIRRERVRRAMERGDDVVLDAVNVERYHLSMRVESRPEGI